MSLPKNEFFNPKQENLAYTIAIIKPDTALYIKSVQEIIDKIEEQGFVIKNMIQRELIRQEVQNVFYKQEGQPYYDDIIDYMLSGECVVLLLCHETENPIEKWKKMIGKSDPEQAKKEDPNCLRAKYGKSILKNELHGSDTTSDANKERDVFKFPIPQKIPEFHFDTMKINIDTIFKFIFPPNLEHVVVNERLDIFALYGPILNHHSVDKCLCTPCSRIGKEVLELRRKEIIIEEKKKLGISTKNDAQIKRLQLSMSTSKKGTKQETKVNIPPIRLLNEENISSIYNQLCDKCKHHCDSYAHLVGGRGAQHILSDQEIEGLAKEINKQELLDLLIIEKGNAANIMIEQMSLKEPEEISYNRDLIRLLFKDVPTDYYERYNFSDLQQVIQEDRRIRMNAWVAKLINKSIEKFSNPKLIDPTVTQKERQNLKSIHFTLNRTLPLSMITQKPNISYVPIEFPQSIVDKPKLQQNEEKIALLQKLHRHTTHMVSIDNVGAGDEYKINVALLRNYNEGRHGSWNNYASLLKSQKGTYVQTKNHPVNHEFQ
ncbi:nucleoside diphosphate kinase (macronuclear) [Tetrahymena thermophila SB210]|uniref:Nucleoside diphosphate kinase n=1 Tax=Tetrahymena thermophila (strain SB210) TaxID=312017 RepID=Q23U54_TETTS|nr:nucleoside diphosphate kinase [Tetrahymena thermophila SB210]EAS00090.1 nucleoside diphosphate kinase [Tetrahymena thermophila SB210]|eukprot:XP_001020335.1 nucleoside diphosphate kinase [Tetrahymena thermophila SB210]